MNLTIFFEGTGQGVAGRVTNVTRLRDACVEDDRQMLHLESGPGTHAGAILGGNLVGLDWRDIFRSARRWFEASYESLPADGTGTSVYLFGFSRGALLARHFAEWLNKLGIAVAYLGLWDTVDSIVGLDVAVECPSNVRVARHAVARDERRRFYDYVPLRRRAGDQWQTVEELVFPGSHSDVGGLYADNHVIADVTLAWIAQRARRAGLRLKRGVRLVQKFNPAEVVLHDSRRHATNLWGALGERHRTFVEAESHRSCALLPKEYGTMTVRHKEGHKTGEDRR